MRLNSIVKLEISKISEVAGYLWQRGWCERNAGNISLNLTGLIEVSKADLIKEKFIEAKVPEKSSGMTIFFTGTGERLRDLINKPSEAACIIHIDSKANGYYIIWGGEGKPYFRPTSEFASHLSIHLANTLNNNESRCVLHTHPNELIAISHHPQLGVDSSALNKALWSMLPEIKIYVPKGIMILPYKLPGSNDLAKATVEALASHEVILWSKHGALATGKDAIEAFDFIDVANKGAIIYLKCLEAGFVPTGLSDKEIDGLDILAKN